MRTTTLLSLALLLLAACAPAGQVPPAATPSDIQLSVARTATGTLQLTLLNGSSGEIGYNLCSSTLQKRRDDIWTDVQTNDICTMEIRGLAPGAKATFDKRLASDVAAGEYRYVTPVEIRPAETRALIASNSFRVP